MQRLPSHRSQASGAGEETDESAAPAEPVKEPVTLHVYDLNERLRGANKVMKNLGTGVYHAAVEVYGFEWSFGYCEDDSGVFCCEPRKNPCFAFKQSVVMGHTELQEHEVDNLIDMELMDEWPGESYHLLQRNCTDFSNEFCKRLGVGPVPGWVKSAAGVGSFIEDVMHMRQLKEMVRQGRRVRGTPSIRPELKRGLSGAISDIPDFCAGVQSVAVRKGSQVLQEGKLVRGATPTSEYEPGDFARGVFALATGGMKNVLAQGRIARDASEEDVGYKFGDFTRGMISAMAKR